MYMHVYVISLQETTEEITEGITASVQSYFINIVPIAVNAPSINITIVCRAMCKYTFQNTTKMSALHYSVIIAAKNVLSDGYSESSKCSNKTISKAILILNCHLNCPTFCRC